jgi:predicted dehydrogenase
LNHAVNTHNDTMTSRKKTPRATPATVLLAGAGQLGSRYLQGFVTSRTPLQIHVVDPSAASLERAASRWQEVVDTAPVEHEVAYATDFVDLPATVDLAVVASTADVRTSIVRQIQESTAVQYWLLEKVLCQVPEEIDDLLAMTADSRQAWVNTPRSAMPLYHQIRDGFALKTPVYLQVTGGNWGLACNAIHFLELLAWLTGEFLEHVDTEGLEAGWLASKRTGFAEVNGCLLATFSQGSTLALSCSASDIPLDITIRTEAGAITIDESRGQASDDQGRVVHGEMKFQSALSGPMAETILTRGYCDLPTLAQSAVTHRAYLTAMLAHYRQSMDNSAVALPVT